MEAAIAAFLSFVTKSSSSYTRIIVLPLAFVPATIKWVRYQTL